MCFYHWTGTVVYLRYFVKLFAVFDGGKLKVCNLLNNGPICCCAWQSEHYSPYICSFLIVSIFATSQNFLVFREKVAKLFLQVWCYWQFSKLCHLQFNHFCRIYGFFDLSIVDWFRKLNLWSILSQFQLSSLKTINLI